MRLQSSTQRSPMAYHGTSHKPIVVLTLGAASNGHAFIEPLLAAPDAPYSAEPARSGIQFYRVDAPAMPGEELDA